MNAISVRSWLLIFFFFCAPLQGKDRVVLQLDKDWKFIKEEISLGQEMNLDNGSWSDVEVPHDWAIAGPFNLNQDMQFVKVIEDGDKEARLRTGRTGALPATGIGWYRRLLHLPADYSGQRVYIEFDGVMSNAQVYLNGKLIGQRPYGYSSFSFDLTDHFSFGTNNILSVRVENKPEMSRFYTGAGIYRPVRLLCTSPVHVAHWGTNVTTPQITSKKGVANVKTLIKNTSHKEGKIRLLTEVYDNYGKRVASASSTQTSRQDIQFEQNCTIKNPMLWNVETPTLYTIVSKVYVNNELCDTYHTNFGFRTLKFDKDKGFFLNGESLKIKGACMHHDLGPLGAAVNWRATERQIEILKEMGCNAIRTSHNPSSVELLDLCDKMGMLVQVEAFDEWKLGKCVNGYNLFFDQWAETDLTDLIHRDRNHPCVIMWSIGNELREQDDANGGKVARFLSDIVHREDPTRPSTAGFNNHWAAIANGLADAVDLVGFNYKHFDYVHQRKEHPDYILYGSETSSAVSSRGIYKFPVKDNWEPWYNDYQISSYDMDYVPWGSAPDTEFSQQDDNEFLLGEFVWTGFDYLGEPSPYGDGAPSRSSYFGIVDLAGLKKDRFYLYQSQWSDKPVLHIMPHWTWPDRVGQVVPVQCYTNYPKVELFVNGVSMGVKEKDPTSKFTRYRMMWDSVKYEPGEIKLVAYDSFNKACEEKIVRTAGRPYQIRLTADRNRIKADGKDLSFVTLEVIDENGNVCPRDASMLFVKVVGNGSLKALCNGDATDLTSFTSNYMRTFSGKMVAIVQGTDTPEDLKVVVSGERLKTSELVIHVE
ncbi:beta-galactosidase GalB [Bacteroides nordii]|uniref:beta-galactosidase GalB n=1 Tax=Bacteroides nordii TaxID=291645 RepID=UPI002A81E91A|nr:beta-galactosidase GalB [Bacteroides nordii]